MKYGEEWSVSIRRGPGHTEALYTYWSPQLGRQIWDVMMWPLETTPLTEAQLLAELYQVVTEFWSTRA